MVQHRSQGSAGEPTGSGQIEEYERLLHSPSEARAGEGTISYDAAFASLLSHKLRNPLAVIHGHAELLARAVERAGFSNLERHSAQVIIASVEQMDSLIQDLVDALRQEAGQLWLRKRVVNLGSLIGDLLNRAPAGLEAGRIQCEVPADLPGLSADAARVERILVNLLTNALKYSSAKSRVSIKAEKIGSSVVVSVIDQGVGMMAEELAQILDPNLAPRGVNKAEGLGLGLYVCRMLVEAQGGQIWAESEPGKGSAFYFTLPIANDKP